MFGVAPQASPQNQAKVRYTTDNVIDRNDTQVQGYVGKLNVPA